MIARWGSIQTRSSSSRPFRSEEDPRPSGRAEGVDFSCLGGTPTVARSLSTTGPDTCGNLPAARAKPVCSRGQPSTRAAGSAGPSRTRSWGRRSDSCRRRTPRSDGCYRAAKVTALAILASLQAALGDLDRVQSWLRVVGYIHCAPGFNRNAEVLDGFSDVIVDLWGEAGRHARSAPGQGPSPFGVPLIIDAMVAVN